MSVKGDFGSAIGMSALPPIADMCGATRDVCFVPIADIAPFSATTKSELARSYRTEITSPLRSAATISPAWRPASVSTAPFWLVSTIAPAPGPTAAPAPAAP